MAAMVASGYDILTSLLPFVLLFGFWIFLMKNVRGRLPTQYPAARRQARGDSRRTGAPAEGGRGA
jgi:hypothetical protein